MKIKGGIVMPVTDSPLRYPGGKTKIYAKVKRIIDSALDEENRIYIEPYAGGAGLALKLLYKGDVEQIILNDLDYHIYCFWKVCMSESQAFCSRIKNIDVSLEEWEKQKNIYINGNNHTELEIGFATFFLNRCNVSGIIEGGPIGGKEQTGMYKINARYNKENLIKKIEKLSLYKEKIQIYNTDALEFLDTIIPALNQKNIFLNIDPPYVKKGPMLYKNAYTDKDHEHIAKRVKKLQGYWIVTYDACDFIKKLYEGFVIEDLELSYSAGKSKTGREYIIYSKRIRMENTND